MKKPPFRVGDRVTSSYWGGQEKIVRRITEIFKRSDCYTGFNAAADGGEPCRCCGRIGTPIRAIDSGWFEKVKE